MCESWRAPRTVTVKFTGIGTSIFGTCFFVKTPKYRACRALFWVCFCVRFCQKRTNILRIYEVYNILPHVRFWCNCPEDVALFGCGHDRTVWKMPPTKMLQSKRLCTTVATPRKKLRGLLVNCSVARDPRAHKKARNALCDRSRNPHDIPVHTAVRYGTPRHDPSESPSRQRVLVFQALQRLAVDSQNVIC